jgi:small conductance mechanosensitive channel
MKNLLTRFGLGDLAEWAELLQTGLRVVVIVILAWLLLIVVGRLIRALRAYLTRQSEGPEQLKRIETLARAMRYTTTVIICVLTITLILSELGISIAPILATAGVAGVAIGFGAQNLVKDYFNGLFVLIENQIRQGDVVEVAGKSGLVEEVTLRYIRLRDYEGTVHFIPNGQITMVTNRSFAFAYAVIDVSVAYREDVDEVYALMKQVAQDMRGDPALAAKIIDDLEIAGVDQWAESAVIIRCRFKVVAMEQWGVRREFLYRLKKVFDAHDIEIPFRHLTVYAGSRKDNSAPPFHLAGELSAAATPASSESR